MARKIISDSHAREDFGYDRGHSQTRGGEEAYRRGEKPMTYWQKKDILIGIAERFNYMRHNADWHKKYNRLLRDLNRSEAEILAELKKLSKAELQSFFLQFTGFHLTGNYFRHTDFFGFISLDDFLPMLRRLIKPRLYEQLTIKEIIQ